jgi:hypothetical protein
VAPAANLDALADRLSGGGGRALSLPGLGLLRLGLPGLCWQGLCLPRLCLPRLCLPGLCLPGLGNRARLGGSLGTAHVTDDVRQRLKVVGPLLCRVRRKSHHVPAARHHKPCRMHLAQVP